MLPPLTDCGVDSHFALLSRIRDRDAFLDAFENYGAPSLSAALPALLEERLAAMIAGRTYDLIHVERSYCGHFLLRLLHRLRSDWNTRPAITLDLDEDDAAFYAQASEIHDRAGDLQMARQYAIEARAFGKLIGETAGRFDRVWTSSPLESRALRGKYGVQALDARNSVAITSATRLPRPSSRSLLFVGSMGHMPNVDAMRWFLDAIWPRLAGGGFTLDIVGHPLPPFLLRAGRQPGVNVHGWVPDLAPFYGRAALCIAPIRFGSGTRVKLLEYAANGVPVVSTRMAAEGLDFSDGRDIWLADTSEGFASAIRDAVMHPGEAARRAKGARALVMRLHDRRTVIAELAREFQRVLGS